MKKERDTRVPKIIAVFLLVVIVFPTFCNIFGAINDDYEGAKISISAGVPSGNESGNVIAQPIFWLINTVASMGESIITKFSTLMAKSGISTQTTDENRNKLSSSYTPWADAIIYNAVSALDVNFINPSQGSFASIISTTIKQIYYTIFSISITFFSIAVLIMAIRLATTAIASEKARYKESIVNFIISLILIFSMHYFMSFCFYLNESLVRVAYHIVKSSLEGTFDAALNNETITKKQQKKIENIGNDGNWSYKVNYFEDATDKDMYPKISEYLSDIILNDETNKVISNYLGALTSDFIDDADGDRNSYK